MYCATKAFISRVERHFIFSTLISAFFYIKEWRSPSRRVEKMKVRSTQDINALGTQHMKGAFFFSQRFIEWDTCNFSLTIKFGRAVYNLTLYQLKPLLQDLVVHFIEFRA